MQVLRLQIRPDIACLARFAGIMYMNLTNTFPTDGTVYPVFGSGLGTTMSSTIPYLLVSSCTSATRSWQNWSSNRSSGQHMFSNCSTREGIALCGGILIVICTCGSKQFSQDCMKVPAKFEGLVFTYCASCLNSEAAFCTRSLRSPTARLFSAFIAFSLFRGSSYQKKQQPLHTPISELRLNCFSLPNVSQMLRTVGSSKQKGIPPMNILFPWSTRLAFSSRYRSSKQFFGFRSRRAVPAKVQSACCLKYSLALRFATSRTANPPASRVTSLAAAANSGASAASTSLKNISSSSALWVESTPVIMILRGWLQIKDHLTLSSSGKSYFRTLASLAFSAILSASTLSTCLSLRFLLRRTSSVCRSSSLSSSLSCGSASGMYQQTNQWSIASKGEEQNPGLTELFPAKQDRPVRSADPLDSDPALLNKTPPGLLLLDVKFLFHLNFDQLPASLAEHPLEVLVEVQSVQQLVQVPDVQLSAAPVDQAEQLREGHPETVVALVGLFEQPHVAGLPQPALEQLDEVPGDVDDDFDGLHDGGDGQEAVVADVAHVAEEQSPQLLEVRYLGHLLLQALPGDRHHVRLEVNPDVGNEVVQRVPQLEQTAHPARAVQPVGPAELEQLRPDPLQLVQHLAHGEEESEDGLVVVQDLRGDEQGQRPPHLEQGRYLGPLVRALRVAHQLPAHQVDEGGLAQAYQSHVGLPRLHLYQPTQLQTSSHHVVLPVVQHCLQHLLLAVVAHPQSLLRLRHHLHPAHPQLPLALPVVGVYQQFVTRGLARLLYDTDEPNEHELAKLVKEGGSVLLDPVEVHAVLDDKVQVAIPPLLRGVREPKLQHAVEPVLHRLLGPREHRVAHALLGVKHQVPVRGLAHVAHHHQLAQVAVLVEHEAVQRDLEGELAVPEPKPGKRVLEGTQVELTLCSLVVGVVENRLALFKEKVVELALAHKVKVLQLLQHLHQALPVQNHLQQVSCCYPAHLLHRHLEPTGLVLLQRLHQLHQLLLGQQSAAPQVPQDPHPFPHEQDLLRRGFVHVGQRQHLRSKGKARVPVGLGLGCGLAAHSVDEELVEAIDQLAVEDPVRDLEVQDAVKCGGPLVHEGQQEGAAAGPLRVPVGEQLSAPQLVLFYSFEDCGQPGEDGKVVEEVGLDGPESEQPVLEEGPLEAQDLVLIGPQELPDGLVQFPRVGVVGAESRLDLGEVEAQPDQLVEGLGLVLGQELDPRVHHHAELLQPEHAALLAQQRQQQLVQHQIHMANLNEDQYYDDQFLFSEDRDARLQMLEDAFASQPYDHNISAEFGGSSEHHSQNLPFFPHCGAPSLEFHTSVPLEDEGKQYMAEDQDEIQPRQMGASHQLLEYQELEKEWLRESRAMQEELAKRSELLQIERKEKARLSNILKELGERQQEWQYQKEQIMQQLRELRENERRRQTQFLDINECVKQQQQLNDQLQREKGELQDTLNEYWRREQVRSLAHNPFQPLAGQSQNRKFDQQIKRQRDQYENKLERLNQELRELRQRKERQSRCNNCEKHLGSIADLTSQNEQLEATILELNDKIMGQLQSFKQQSRKKGQPEEAAMRKLCEGLKKRCESYQDELRGKDQQLIMLNKEKVTLLDRNSFLQSENNNIENNYLKLHDQYVEARAKAEESSRLRSRVSELNEEGRLLRQKVSSLEQALGREAALKDQSIGRLSDDLSCRQREVALMEKELASKLDQLKKATGRIKNLQEANQKLQKQAEATASVQSQIHRSEESARKNCAELTQRVKKLELAVQQKEKKRSSAEGQAKRVALQLQSLKRKNEMHSAQRSNKTAESSKRQSELAKRESYLKKKEEETKKSMSVFYEQISKMKASNERQEQQFKSEIARLKESNAGLKQNNSALKEVNSQLQAQLEDLVAKSELLAQAKAEPSKADEQLLSEMVAELQGRVQQLQQQLAEKSAANSQLAIQNRNWISQLSKWKRKEKESRELLTKAEFSTYTLKSDQEEVLNCRAAVKKANEEKARLQQQKARLAEEKARLQAEGQRQAQQLEARLLQREEELSQLKQTGKQRELALASSQKECQKRRISLQILRQRVLQIDKDKLQMEAQIKLYQLRNQQLIRQLQKYQSRTAQLEQVSRQPSQEQVFALRKKVDLLSAALSKKAFERELNPESLSKEQTMALLLGLLEKVSLSADLCKKISSSESFGQLLSRVGSARKK